MSAKDEATAAAGGGLLLVERVQTGVRMEKRLLKVLKALAELLDMTLGDLLEGIVLHAFDGQAPFSAATLARIAELKRIYGLDLDASASHRLTEGGARGAERPATPAAGASAEDGKAARRGQGQAWRPLARRRATDEERILNDRDFLAAFESCTLPEDRFHHRDHIRLAWLMLREAPLAATLVRFTAGLERFAASLGKPGLYHATITWAYLFLIHQRMRLGIAPEVGATWEEFAAANPDLLTWQPSVLRRLLPRGDPALGPRPRELRPARPAGRFGAALTAPRAAAVSAGDAASPISASLRLRGSLLMRCSSASAAPQLAASADQARATGRRERV